MPFSIPNGSGALYTEHVPGSPRIAYTQTGATGTRTWDIAGDDLFNARQGLLGYPKTVVGLPLSGGTVRHIARSVPDFFPGELDSAGKPWLYATKVDAAQLNPRGQRPIAGGGNLPYAGTTRLTIGYEALPWEILSDAQMLALGGSAAYLPAGGAPIFDLIPDESSLLRYVCIRPKPQAESFGVPAGTFKDVDPTKPAVSYGLNKQLVTWDLEILWCQVPKTALPCAVLNPNLLPDGGNLELTLGKINSAPFAGCALGTLLLLAAELKPIRTALGDRAYDVSYRFKRMQAHIAHKDAPTRSVTWTHLFHRPPNLPLAWYEISSDGTTNITGASNFSDDKSMYNWADFRLLFRAQ